VRHAAQTGFGCSISISGGADWRSPRPAWTSKPSAGARDGLSRKSWKTLHWPPFDWLAGRADVYHFPNFIIPPLTSGRTVVTVHDVSFLRYPAMAEAKNLAYLKASIANTVRRADAVITDSRFSAEEITELLRADPAKVFFHPIGRGGPRALSGPGGGDAPAPGARPHTALPADGRHTGAAQEHGFPGKCF